MSEETEAATALLAYFNRDLAKQLVERLLKNTSKAAWARLTTRVLDMVPEACKDTVWQLVVKHARHEGAKYVETAEFRQKAEESLKRNADYWIEQALAAAVKDLVVRHATNHVKNYEGQYIKTIPGKFQAYVEEELRHLAKEKAKETHAASSIV
jgi:hypothetical protein